MLSAGAACGVSVVRAAGLREKFVAGEGELDLHRKLRLGNLADGGLEQLGNFLQHGIAFDFRPVFREAGQRREDGLGSVGEAKILEGGITERAGGIELAQGFGLFARNIKVTVLLQRALGAFPPFFVIGGRDNVGRKERLNIVGRGLRAEAADAILDHGDRILRGFFLQRVERLDLLHGNVVGSERRERLGRIGELHDVARLGLEIDDDAFVRRVPILDFAKAPTAVGAIGSGGKELQFFRQRGGKIFRQGGRQ